MQFPHSISDLNPKYTDILSSTWHELAYSVAVQIELLCSQPFENNNFHFPLLWSQWHPRYQLNKNTIKHSHKFIV